MSNAHTIEWADPTGNKAARIVDLARLGVTEELLQSVENHLRANPADGVRRASRTLNCARLKTEAAIESLIATDRLRVVGGLYV